MNVRRIRHDLNREGTRYHSCFCQDQINQGPQSKLSWITFQLLHHPYEAQDTATPRWTIGEHSTTAEKKKQKRATNVHRYHFSVCDLLEPRNDYHLFKFSAEWNWTLFVYRNIYGHRKIAVVSGEDLVPFFFFAKKKDNKRTKTPYVLKIFR